MGIDISLDDAKAGAGPAEGEQRGRRGCRPGFRRARGEGASAGRRGLPVSRNVLYGAPWGIIGGALTYYWVAPRAPGSSALLFTVIDHSTEICSFAIYFSLVVGMFGYLIRAVNPRRAYLSLMDYVQGYVFGAVLVIFLLVRLDVNLLGAETPILGYVLPCCLIALPVADFLLLLATLNFWRRE